MNAAIWSAEIKELETLYSSFKGSIPYLVKELEPLINADNAMVVMVYSRRSLELIVTELCEKELNKKRKTEPLQDIIDKLNNEEKVPSNVTVSMYIVNSLSAYGQHPKEFEVENIKPVLINLTIIIGWYLKYKRIPAKGSNKPYEVKPAPEQITITHEKIKKLKNKLLLIRIGIPLLFFVILAIIWYNVSFKEQENVEKSLAVLPFTSNQLAYEFYLKGNEYYTQGRHLMAVDMYSKAIGQDSLFAAAYAKRANIYMTVSMTKDESRHGYIQKAREDIIRALRLNPELNEVKFVKAISYYRLDKNYDNALKILNEIKRKAPQMAEIHANICYILRRQGKFEEANIEMKQAIQIDPLNAYFINELAHAFRILHQFDDEIETAKKGIARVPDFENFRYHIFFGLLYKNGDMKTALRESGLRNEDVQYYIYYYTKQFETLIEFIKNDTLEITEDQFIYCPKSYRLAFIYFMNNNKTLCNIYTDSAITFYKAKIKEDPSDERFWASLGKCYAFIGKNKEAIECGIKAVNLKPVKLDAMQGISKEQDLMEIYIFTGNYDMAMDRIEYLSAVPSYLYPGDLLVNPIFDKLRFLPRFQKIIKSLKK